MKNNVYRKLTETSWCNATPRPILLANPAVVALHVIATGAVVTRNTANAVRRHLDHRHSGFLRILASNFYKTQIINQQLT